MKTISILIAAGAVVIAALSGCSASTSSMKEEGVRQPAAEREFRAVWVATVGNIDWPSKPGLTTEEQQREARAILDTVAALGMNAVVFQVRPHTDAMYKSDLEPWSYYLTGEEGKAPEPYYDPLTFWVEEAHDRGIELHAWFNPYRVRLSRAGEINDSSIIRRKPELVRQLSGGTWWMDPGDPRTLEHSFSVIMDVVRRYDVDGIHFDDYFYPYGGENFPDSITWTAYVQSGGSLTRSDWRRDNVNKLIERLANGVKKEKRHVQFGISPFGIWRPGYPPSITGFDQYNGLYADAKLWLQEGWVDYFTPQLYWPINQTPQSFPVLLGWWTRVNTMGRNLWPGLYTGRMIREEGLDELINEIMVARGFVPEGPGHIHFSMRSFQRDSSALNDGLRNGPYRKPALVPRTPWLDDTAPSAPAVKATVDTMKVAVSWAHDNVQDVFQWVVYRQYDGQWQYSVEPRYARGLELMLTQTVEDRIRRRRSPDSIVVRTETLTRVAVSAVDRLGNESEKVFIDLPVVSGNEMIRREGVGEH
ncbi:MAG: hypothetical protein A3C56_00725 [Ignavibacteria bacterium RIFCSPHIGHO2_02_FULL_56_12]|nr:MAG: hypothetical protein A3C56_00725 [Ignavibacteria bacterium RIFCSPHIGHO2_02_FULL_56_12]